MIRQVEKKTFNYTDKGGFNGDPPPPNTFLSLVKGGSNFFKGGGGLNPPPQGRNQHLKSGGGGTRLTQFSPSKNVADQNGGALRLYTTASRRGGGA